MPLEPQLRSVALATKGFMPADEGDALYDAGLAAGRRLAGLPWVEVGSYCGRSTVWLGAAARASATVLFAVDHHHGSDENQAGWEHHDPEVVDERTGRMDTLPFFRRTIVDAGLEEQVVAIVGRSPQVAAHWAAPLAMLFIDGGHGVEHARADYSGWTPHVALDGTLAIHDVFADPADGGQAPYDEIYRPAIASGDFELDTVCGSLHILRRVR